VIVAVLGEAEMEKSGTTMAKLTLFDKPPPGEGLNTCTSAVPATAMSLAGIEACNCVSLTKVVIRSLPFHRTTEAETNPVPFTVKVKPDPPTMALPGEMELIEGAGLPVTVNVNAFDVPPPGEGLNTVT
jgi:hypothetical protein